MTDDAHHPGLACWSCRARLSPKEVVQDGILRAREDSRGGPFRIVTCRACQSPNLCERTRRGRWFCSPTERPNLVDYLFGRLLDSQPESFLRSVAWHRDNEERRRYFFERDDDRRYSGGQLLSRLWSFWSAPEGEPRTATNDRPRGGESRERPAGDRPDDARSRNRRGDDGSQRRDEWSQREEREERERARRQSGDRREAPGVASPWAILGVDEDADEATIRAAFHRLAVQYHPDKVHHLGEEFQRVATERFKELQRAYEVLTRGR